MHVPWILSLVEPLLLGVIPYGVVTIWRLEFRLTNVSEFIFLFTNPWDLRI